MARTDRRPLIGLPGRRKRIGQINGFPDSLAGLRADLYFADYASAVYAAGGLPVHLPLDVAPADWVGVLDGLVLTGGADIEPERYGHDNLASDTEPLRDDIEFGLYGAARQQDVPVLGICRGLQLINVAEGGTLHQQMPEHARYDLAPDDHAHDVQIVAGSVLHELYGAHAHVNSLHHQTIGDLGRGLAVTATAADGTVEGLELAGAPVIAVQWHPEMIDHADPAFRWIVEAAQQR